MRAVAFELLAQLAAFGNCDAYKEQLHTNMCALILHLFDAHAEVTITKGYYYYTKMASILHLPNVLGKFSKVQMNCQNKEDP